MSLPSKLPSYPRLLNQVREVLVEGQKRIELERVRTYWETGRVIQSDILKNKSRANYGEEVLASLAIDLDLNVRILQQCIRFVKVYPQFPNTNTCSYFKWSHYRELITISDPKKRTQLEKAVIKNQWTSHQLVAYIKKNRLKPKIENPKKLATLIEPSRGALYTYSTFTSPEVFAVTGKVLADCGFHISYRVKVRDWPQVSFKKTMNYTYRAHVVKVIDGDTIIVDIDLGFDIFVNQRLRLRGIDCPEMSTLAGEKAKAFVQRMVKKVKTITIVTFKADKYDRYLADIWIGDDYLNQKLLDKELAILW